VRPGVDLPGWDEALLRADPGEEWVVAHRDYGTHKRVEIAFTVLLDAGIPVFLRTEPFAGKWSGQFYWGRRAAHSGARAGFARVPGLFRLWALFYLFIGSGAGF